jgi:MFS family permease
MVVMNIVYALVAGPAGPLLDRTPRWKVLIGGLAALVLADLAIAGLGSLCGNALGVFNLPTGATLFVAGALAGEFWRLASPAAFFLTGCGFAAAAAVGLAVLQSEIAPRRRAA